MVCVLVATALAAAQSPPASMRALRTTPTEKLTVNPGFRDWSPTTIAGGTIVGGNRTNRGGVVAIDAASGRVKWTFRPVLNGGTASVATAPAVSGDVVITPFAAAAPGAVIAVSLATGKEIWRGPDPARGAAVAVDGPLAFVLGKDGHFRALDVATGQRRWAAAFTTNRAVCASSPIVHGGVVYVTGSAAAGYFLFALDADTGRERWRYRADAPDAHDGVCLRQPVVTADTVFAAGDNYLYAVTRETGRDRWKPIEVRRAVEGRVRAVEVHGLVDAGPVVVGMTDGFVIAFDKTSGATAWEIAGPFPTSTPSMTVAEDVLYFQGSPDSARAAAPRGTLHALDLGTRAILWSFSRPTAEAGWPFGSVAAVDRGLWVDSYQALVKLQ